MSFFRPHPSESLRQRFADWRRERKEAKQAGKDKRRLTALLMAKTAIWDPPKNYIPIIPEWDKRYK